jgi:hypothetical protein
MLAEIHLYTKKMADIESSDTHLEDIDDGCGCTEIWEKMSDLMDEEQEDSE